MTRSVVDLFESAVMADPDHEAMIDGDRRLTLAGWWRAAGGLATAWADVGVERGDVVCVVLPSSVDYAVCYVAALRLGAITSGVNPRLGPAEVDHIVERTEAKVVVTDPQVLRDAFDLDPPDRRRDVDAADPVAIVWTSGTTGRPKGAVFDSANLAAVSRGAGALSAQGDRRLSPLPFAHVGWMTRLWDEVEHRVTTVIVPTPWRADEALRLIGSERVTVAQGVPTQWALMLASPALERTDLSSLRLAATGGSPVPAELVAEMRRRLGCPVVVRYTSTEAALTTGTRPDDRDKVVADTVGRAQHGVEVRVDAPAADVGPVLVRSDAVMRGYWRDAEATAAVLSPDGWLDTGDLGSLDADGNLVLAGRRSEMYMRGGYNVYPSEVEAVLSEHPGVARVAVAGGPDPVLGQVGHAFVVPVDGAAPDLEELRGWCRRRLADYKAPDRVHLVDDLPLTAMQKVDKRALLASWVEL